MKKIYLIPALLGGLFVSELDSQAQQQNIRELFLKEFDKNKDGKLDENERPSREQMQEFFQRQQGNTPSRPGAGSGGPGQGRPGTDGGRPGEGGRGQSRPGTGGGRGQGGNMRELMLKEFDKNGDGQLDENERPSREQAQEFFRRQQGNTPNRPSSRPGEGRPGEGRPGEGRPGEGGRGQGGFGGRGGFRPSNPVMEAIDKNKDGTLTADELKNASKALAALDKNKDGKIDQEEMRPQFDRGQGGREGFRRPSQGGQGGGREGFRRPGQEGGQNRPEAPRGREGFRRPGQDGGQGRPEVPRGRDGQPSRPGRSES